MMADDDSFWPSRLPAQQRPNTVGSREKQSEQTSTSRRRAESPTQHRREPGEPWLDFRDSQEVYGMKEVQSRTFANIQEAKKMLTAFNQLSTQNLEQTNAELQKSAALIRVLTADLNVIFQKTRALRMRLRSRLPDAAELAAPCPYEEED